MNSTTKRPRGNFFPQTSFRWYQTYRLLIPIFFAGYVIAALQPGPAGLPEIYPFFKWHLFPNAPAETTGRIELMVRSIDGEAFETRRGFFSLGDRFDFARERDVRVSKALAPMFAAIRRNDHETVARFRQLLEHTYMREANSVEYEIVITGYDPIERYHTGNIDRIHTIASFAKKGD